MIVAFATQKQFMFIRDTIVESITCGDTEITAANLEGAIFKMKNQNIFQHEMKVIKHVLKPYITKRIL